MTRDLLYRAVWGGLAFGLSFLVWFPLLAAGEGDASKAKPIYEKHCLLCHGPEGRGDGPMGKLLKPPATNFASPESQSRSDVELLKTIREGHPKTAMTTWKGILSEDDFRDLVAYVRRLSRGLDGRQG